MMNPWPTSDVAKAHREDLLHEAHRERLAAEALAARDPDHEAIAGRVARQSSMLRLLLTQVRRLSAVTQNMSTEEAT
jgi:hypothetical protein